MEINLEGAYWDRLKGYATDLRVDSRWILRKDNDDRAYGSLRIVSHPDLKPGHLRAFFSYIKKIEEKSDSEILKTVEDYQISIGELEVYSIHDNIDVEREEYEASFKELEEIFGVKIFDK